MSDVYFVEPFGDEHGCCQEALNDTGPADELKAEEKKAEDVEEDDTYKL